MSVPIRMPLPKRFTLEEYLILERKAKAKSEFHQGQIFARASASPGHSLISSNISTELAMQLKGRACRVYNSELRLAVADSEAVCYADVAVVCGELKYSGRHRDVVANAKFVVEVCSRSTARYDRLVKVPLYQQTPSISDILLVAQDRPQVEHLTRTGGQWKSVIHTSLAGTIPIPGVDCALAISDVYANVGF